MRQVPSIQELSARALAAKAAAPASGGDTPLPPSHARIQALRDVIAALEGKPPGEVMQAERRAIDHLNDGLLWLIEAAKAEMMRGMHGKTN